MLSVTERTDVRVSVEGRFRTESLVDGRSTRVDRVGCAAEPNERFRGGSKLGRALDCKGTGSERVNVNFGDGER